MPDLEIIKELKAKQREVRRGTFRPMVPLGYFSTEERDLLNTYGSWMEHLMLGRIGALTEEQLHFQACCALDVAPWNRFEEVWMKYLEEIPGDYEAALHAREVRELEVGRHREARGRTFAPLFSIDHLSVSEVELLMTYGAWMEHLLLGKIEPISIEQRHFLSVCAGGDAPQTLFEDVWLKYIGSVVCDYKAAFESRRTEENNHSEARGLSFFPLASIEDFSEIEKKMLESYGAWMENLMLGNIAPLTNAQHHFLSTCSGAIAPQHKLEVVWLKYLAKVPDYKEACRARAFESEANSLLRQLPPNDYKEARRVRTNLAAKGHQPSIEWLKYEGPWVDMPSTGKGASSWDIGATYGALAVYDGAGNNLLNHDK